MNECSAYVGLDVHKDTIAVAVALPGRGEPGIPGGEIKNQRSTRSDRSLIARISTRSSKASIPRRLARCRPGPPP